MRKAYKPCTTKAPTLNCGWLGRIMGISPPPGSPPAALIACSLKGAMTGQKYHGRLTGSLRDRLPRPVSRSDGYRFAPYLAVFDRHGQKRANEKISDFAFLTACLQVVLAHPPESLCRIRLHQLTYSGQRIFSFQRAGGQKRKSPLTA